MCCFFSQDVSSNTKVVIMDENYWLMSKFSSSELRTEHGVVPTSDNPSVPERLGSDFPYVFHFKVRGLPTTVIIDNGYEGRTGVYLFGGRGASG